MFAVSLENACMMYTFGSLITLIVIVEIGCAATIVVFKDETWKLLNTELIHGMQNYGNETSQASQDMTSSWDKLQTEMQCCGVKKYTDWGQVQIFNETQSVPDSCCITESAGEDCGNGALSPAQPTTIYTDGCLTKLAKFITDNILIFAIVAGLVVVLQIVGIIVACCLARRMKELHNYV